MQERFLDVSHEALIRGWPRLRGWLDEDRVGLRLQRRITEASEEWQRSNRDNDLLYRGARLIQAQEWRGRHETELNPLEREFLDASTALKRRQRQRRLIYWLATLLLLTAFSAIVAIQQRERAVQALESARRIKEVAIKAEKTSVQADYDLSLMYRQKSKLVDPRVLAPLARALRTSGDARLPREILVLLLRNGDWHVPETEPMRHDGWVVAASFSADGRLVVTASLDNTARVWEADSGKPMGEPMRHENPVRGATFNADGRRVVTASDDKTARVWEADSGKPVGEPMRHGDEVFAASFSPDGRWIVTASWDKTARLWDAESCRPVGEPMRHEGRSRRQVSVRTGSGSSPLPTIRPRGCGRRRAAGQ